MLDRIKPLVVVLLAGSLAVLSGCSEPPSKETPRVVRGKPDKEKKAKPDPQPDAGEDDSTTPKKVTQRSSKTPATTDDESPAVDSDPAASDDDNSSKVASRPVDKTAKAVVVAKPIAGKDIYADPRPAKMPKVLLSDRHAKTCKLTVGDALPEAALTDADGKSLKLAEQFGERLTVITFWNSQYPFAMDQLRNLGPGVAARYGDKGVKVLAVNTGDEAAAVKELLEKAGPDLVGLYDPKDGLYDKLATEKLPRTYLVDKDGKILWFDIEYSRATRRELQRAIAAALTEI